MNHCCRFLFQPSFQPLISCADLKDVCESSVNAVLNHTTVQTCLCLQLRTSTSINFFTNMSFLFFSIIPKWPILSMAFKHFQHNPSREPSPAVRARGSKLRGRSIQISGVELEGSSTYTIFNSEAIRLLTSTYSKMQAGTNSPIDNNIHNLAPLAPKMALKTTCSRNYVWIYSNFFNSQNASSLS